MKREIFSNIVLFIATGVLILILGEAAARFFKMESDVMITLDVCTGFKPIPNKHGFVTGSGGIMPITINSAGFRDVEHAVEKETGVFRILFLGDSITEATQVPLEQTFWRQLQKHMNEKEARVEVISFGVASFGTNQELLAYECYGRQYNPDIVILGFFDGNDLTDNYFRNEPFVPRFSLVDDELMLDETYKNQVSKRKSKRATLFPGILYWLKDNSSFMRMLYNKFQLVQKDQTEKKGAQEVNTIFLKEYSNELENAWKMTGALIERLAYEVRMDGGKIVVVHIPALEQLQQEKIKDHTLYDFYKATERLTSIAEKNQIPIIDLYPALMRAQLEKPVNWTTDVHWNKRGHTIVANTLLSELTRLGLLGM